MMEEWCDSQWQTGLKQRCRQTCIAQKGVSTAEVQIMDKTEIMTVIVSMDKTKGVDMIALAWHGSS